MDISILTDWTILTNEGGTSSTATLPTFAAGSARLVQILVVMYNSTTTTPPTSAIADVGGTPVNASLIFSDPANQSRLALALFQFLESQISGINGKVLTTAGASGGTKTILYRVLTDAKQSLPTAQNNAYNTANATQTMSLARVINSMTSAVSFSSISAANIAMSNPTRDATISLTSTRRVSYGDQIETSDNTSNYVATGQGYCSSFVMNIEAFASQVITSVNGGAGIRPGGTVSAVISGYSSAPTAGTFGGKALTGFGGTSTNSTSTMPYYVDGATYPDPDSTQAIILTFGAESGTKNEPLLPPVDHAAITLASVNTTGSNYIGSYLPGVVDGDKIVFQREPGTNASAPTDGFEVYADSGIRATNAGERVCWWWDASTGVMTQLTITVNDAGEIVSVNGLESIGLTSIGPISTGLTSVGL